MVDLPSLSANTRKPDGKSSQTWVRPAQVCASFQGPPWNIMLQNTIYLIQNDTDSAIRGFQQVPQPGALSFCIKRTLGVLEHGGCSPKEGADHEASPQRFPVIHRESSDGSTCSSFAFIADDRDATAPPMRSFFVRWWTPFSCFCDTTEQLSGD